MAKDPGNRDMVFIEKRGDIGEVGILDAAGFVIQ
jgi:hypothetical protein